MPIPFLKWGEKMERIFNYIKMHKLLEQGDMVLIALSGGADSMLVLHTLVKLQDKYDLKLKAVHINHNLRLQAAREAETVQQVCQSLQIPCAVYSEKVDDYAKEHNLSLEAAGHKVRYQIFAQEIESNKANKLALGHHLNDRGETVLLHLLKGCSVSGLAALPFKQGKIIRPLLGLTKEEILQICAREEIKYCTDESNFAPICLRNKLRLELLPLLREQYNPKIDYALANLASLAAEDEQYFAELLGEKCRECVTKEMNKAIIDLNLWREYPMSIKRRLLQNIWQELSGEQRLDFGQIEKIISLTEQEKGSKSLDLPAKWQIIKQYDRLIFTCYNEQEIHEYRIIWQEDEEEVILPFGSINCRESNNWSLDLPKNQIIVDKDKLKKPIIVRSRLKGDKMRPLGSGEKKVKDILIDKKIPASLRSKIPIIESDGKIVCLGSLAVSEEFKVDDKTKSVVIFTFCTN